MRPPTIFGKAAGLGKFNIQGFDIGNTDVTAA